MTIRLRLLLSFALLAFLIPAQGLAQTDIRATLSQPDPSGFPTIEFFLDIHDTSGEFVHDLSPNQVDIIEDGAVLPVKELVEIKPGLQFVVALNPGPSFAIQNSQAVSRYDTISQNLASWAKSRTGSDLDDLSLIINNGPEISHVKDYQQWLQTLESAQIDARNAIPNLDSLFRAVTIANDATIRPGMERAILFITPPIESKEIAPLDNLIAQVQQQNISIHIWLISSAGGFQTAGVQRLTELSEITGGTFFAFSGDETIPDPEIFLRELRSIYQVSYDFSIVSGGIHQISSQIELENGLTETNTLEIEIDLLPPQPTFISPPIRILRKYVEVEQTGNESADTVSQFQPAEQSIQVVFDFPDGRKRPILSSSLWVNGVVVAENSQPPLDIFTWDMREITAAGTYSLQVQVIDSFGITGKSVEIPVFVGIEQKDQDPWRVIRENTSTLISLAVIVSGAILLLVLILGGQLRPRAIRVSQLRRKKSDPVTQPVSMDDDLAKRNIPGWVNRLQWTQHQEPNKAFAYLYPLAENAQVVELSPYTISSNEVLIGSDPNQVNLLLQDGSIEKLHARIVRKVEGSFRIMDEGSIAGTWINYTPVSRNGADLEHGDMIHIGRTGFRFTIRQPKTVRRPVITLMPEKDLESNPVEIEDPNNSSTIQDHSSSEINAKDDTN